MTSQVLIFASRDDANNGYARAKELAALLTVEGVQARLVHKLGFVEEDLLLVAKHRIVTTPSIVVIRSGKVVFRQTSLPTTSVVHSAVSM